VEGHDKVGEAEGLVAVGALDEGDVLASALLTDSRQVLGEADLEGSEEGAWVSVGVSGRLPGVLQEGAEARGAEGPVHQRDDLQDVVSLVHNEGDVMSEDMAGDPLHHSLEGTEKVHVEGLDEGGRAGRDVVHLQLLARGHEGGDGGVILELSMRRTILDGVEGTRTHDENQSSIWFFVMMCVVPARTTRLPLGVMK